LFERMRFFITPPSSASFGMNEVRNLLNIYT
jgi:hypothetical protein